jgi:CRP/FNR family transcriptional regulator
MKTLVSLFHKGRRLTYSKGEFIIRPGETPPGVFYIESGLVKAYDITKYGEENLLVIRKTGEILALTWAVTGEDRSIIYSALRETVVWEISQPKFIEYMRSKPEASLPLIDLLTYMYRNHSERILSLEYRSVRERLISFLLSASRQFGKSAGKGSILIDAPLKHQDIASSINSSRETTSREMAYLERKGIVSTEQSYVTIIDKAALKKYL